MQEDQRKTYIATDQHLNDITLQLTHEIKAKGGSCQQILQAVQSHPQLCQAPELQSLLLSSSSQLFKLITICLQPQKLRIRTRSWPFLAKNLLVRDPPELLLSLLKPDENRARVLFEFLKDAPNQTARGYFAEMLRSIEYGFQDKLLEYMMEDAETLNLCLMKSYYPEVFRCLFSMVVYSSQDHMDFAEKLFRIMLDKIQLPQHCQQYCQNTLTTFQQIRLCYQKLLSGNFLDPQQQQDLKRFCSRMHFLSSTTLTPTYIQTATRLTLQSWKKNPYVCELLLQSLTEIVRIYKVVPEMTKRIEIEVEGNVLEASVVAVLKNMKDLMEILKEEGEQRMLFSNSQEIQVVGMVKCWTLELLEVVLTLEPSLVTANYDMNKGRVLQHLQKFITINPWNNIIHGLVQKIVINLINSFDRYSQLSQDYTGPNGFLGFLIQTFRNHDYMFLTSGNLSNYGYIHYLYNIAQAVCIKLKQSQNLMTIMQKFEDWQEFLVNDLQGYEKRLDVDLGGEPLKLVNEKRLQSHETIRKIVVDMGRKGKGQEEEGSQGAAGAAGDVVNDRFVQVQFRSEAVQARETHLHHRRNTFSTPPVCLLLHSTEKSKSHSPQYKKSLSQMEVHHHQIQNSPSPEKPMEVKKEDLKKYKIMLDETLEKKFQRRLDETAEETAKNRDFKRTISDQKVKQKTESFGSRHKFI